MGAYLARIDLASFSRVPRVLGNVYQVNFLRANRPREEAITLQASALELKVSELSKVCAARDIR